MDKFPIGFWNYTPIAMQDERAVKDWAAAGMTLAMSPEFGVSPEHGEKIDQILDAARDAGISVILCHEQCYWRNLTQKGEEVYRQKFAAAVNRFGKHPAVFGFHVGDEPDAQAFEDACRAIRIQKELAPRLQPFLNLLPWHSGCESRVGYQDWGKYLDDYAAKSTATFLCYDCYAQMNKPEDASGWDMYFRNLREYEAAAKRNDIPWWTTLLSVGHFHYRCPTENDFRWQVNTALAHGARGLLWFFFYMRAPQENYRVSPIDEHGERTGTFEWLSRTCRTFLKSTAPVLNGLTLKRATHAGKAWGGVPPFDGAGRVSRAISKTDLIVSDFVDATGREYAMVVNNNQTESTQADLWFRGVNPALRRVGWLAEEVAVESGDGWSATRGSDFVRVRPWLAPGQAELYRIEDC